VECYIIRDSDGRRSLTRCTTAVMTDWSSEETEDPLCADRRNFYKVEKWSGDGLRIVRS
jgi:hypothetical protein